MLAKFRMPVASENVEGPAIVVTATIKPVNPNEWYISYMQSQAANSVLETYQPSGGSQIGTAPATRKPE